VARIVEVNSNRQANAAIASLSECFRQYLERINRWNALEPSHVAQRHAVLPSQCWHSMQPNVWHHQQAKTGAPQASKSKQEDKDTSHDTIPIE